MLSVPIQGKAALEGSTAVSAAAAAVVVIVVAAASAAVVAEHGEQKDQNDDPPEAVAIVTAHNQHSLSDECRFCIASGSRCTAFAGAVGSAS